MNFLGIFGKTDKQLKKETTKKINLKLVQNREMVYRAVKEYGRPVNGLALAKHMGWDSASVTNRIAELVKKGRVKIAYNKRGLDGKWRRFYEVKENDPERTW